MIRALLVAVIAGLVPTALAAQEDTPNLTTSGNSMGRLIADGYEIKAAVPNGKSFVVFLQKDTTGYACEVVNLSRSVCGKIN